MSEQKLQGQSDGNFGEGRVGVGEDVSCQTEEEVLQLHPSFLSGRGSCQRGGLRRFWTGLRALGDLGHPVSCGASG